MKCLLLILSGSFWLMIASAQNPASITFTVVDAESNHSIKNAKIKIPNTLLPEFSITDETKTIDLQQFQIVPGQILQTVQVTADKYETRSIPPFVVQSGRDTLRVALLSKSSSSSGNNYFVYGVVQSFDLSLRKDVPVVIYSGSKQFSATTDRFGYYFVKLKKSEANASMRIVFSGGRRWKDAVDTINLIKNKYFYAVDAVLGKKNTIQVINGHLTSEKHIPSAVTVTLVCGLETKKTESNASGDFTLSFDAADFEAGTLLPLSISGSGWITLDTTLMVMNEPGTQELAYRLRPSPYFPRSPHEVFASISAFPLYNDFTAVLGYTYHLSAIERRIALKGFGGYRQFEKKFEFKTLPNLFGTTTSDADYFTDTVTQTFQSLIIGAGVAGYLRPFDMNTRWNPVAEFNLVVGPKKDYWLIEPSLSVGTMFNINQEIGITLQAQLSYSHFSHQQPEFNTFADASFVKEGDSMFRPFLVLSLQFFAQR